MTNDSVTVLLETSHIIGTTYSGMIPSQIIQASLTRYCLCRLQTCNLNYPPTRNPILVLSSLLKKIYAGRSLESHHTRLYLHLYLLITLSQGHWTRELQKHLKMHSTAEYINRHWNIDVMVITEAFKFKTMLIIHG